MAGPAQTYAEITKSVSALIQEHTENDPTRTAYMIARAALLQISITRGRKGAAEKAYALADELSTADSLS